MEQYHADPEEACNLFPPGRGNLAMESGGSGRERDDLIHKKRRHHLGAHASGWLILACMHNLWEDPVERRGQMASCYDIVTTEWEGHGRECSTYENPFLWMKRVSNPRHGRRTAFSSTSYTHWIPYFCNTASYRNARTCNGMFLPEYHFAWIFRIGCTLDGLFLFFVSTFWKVIGVEYLSEKLIDWN